MIILGIETSTAQVGCAIGGVEGVLASFHAARGRLHTETLAPAIEFIRRQARVEFDSVGVVAVGIGPGLFTGLRVGMATGKAIALALRVPMVGLSSLDLLAFPLRHTNRVIVPAIDARRGEVFTATYRHVPGGVQRVSPYRACPPAELASELTATAEDCLLVGDGALRYAGVFDQLDHVELGSIGTAYPSAEALVELAHPRALREEFVSPRELVPMYLRPADAEINWATRESA